MQVCDRVGSATWVREQLDALPPGDSWADVPESRELVSWLYRVTEHRAHRAGLTASDRAEVAQDAMPRIVSALKRSRGRIGRSDNPAAVLERIAERAVSAAVHRVWMGGLGGVPANGRHWGAKYPSSIGGDAAWLLVEAIPDVVDQPCREVEDAAATVARWVGEHVRVSLGADALHAVTYVLDRLVAGASRAGLVRGGYIGLASDPAMRHLGFEPATARTFARWLLGRTDPGHEVASVLDAALLDSEVPAEDLIRWRRTALKAGFAHEQAAAALSPALAGPTRRIA